MVLGQVIRVEPHRVEALDLNQPFAADLIEALPRHRLDVVAAAEYQNLRPPGEHSKRRRPGDARARRDVRWRMSGQVDVRT